MAPSQGNGAVSFGPDPLLVGVWMVLVGLPLPIGVLNLIKFGPSPDLLGMLAVCVILPLVVLIFATRFRVSFSETEFTYRRWGATFVIGNADIDHIEVTNRTPGSKDAIGAFVVTKSGKRYAFWPKLFPRAAISRFMALGEVRG